MIARADYRLWREKQLAEHTPAVQATLLLAQFLAGDETFRAAWERSKMPATQNCSCDTCRAERRQAEVEASVIWGKYISADEQEIRVKARVYKHIQQAAGRERERLAEINVLDRVRELRYIVEGKA